MEGLYERVYEMGMISAVMLKCDQDEKDFLRARQEKKASSQQ